jgi:C1A family cysteine protease
MHILPFNNVAIKMSETDEKTSFPWGMGWLPDYPDYRDFTLETTELRPRHVEQGMKPKTNSVNKLLGDVGVTEPAKVSLSTPLSWRNWCSPIENQGPLGSCTAHAGVGLMEYFERRAFGRHIDASRLFLYKATRNLLHWTGDRGAFLRTTMGAMVLFGVCPEEYWRYHIPDFDKEPPAFCYAFSQAYQALLYYRLDPQGLPKSALLTRIKAFLTAGLPSMFGFTVFSSINQARTTGNIPFPCPRERVLGGHAIVAIGFDDNKRIKNRLCGPKTTGAFEIRNSWGTGWGDNGYGWLPYDYVLKGLAVDWWSLLKSEWIATGQFKI